MVGEFGGNDYNAPLFNGRSPDAVSAYVPTVVDSISNAVEVRIYKSQLFLLKYTEKIKIKLASKTEFSKYST